MAKKYVQLDTLFYEGRIEDQVKLMDQAMNILKGAIAKGVKLQDKIRVALPKTVNIDEVRTIISELHAAVRNAEHIYGESRELIDSIYFAIDEDKAKNQNMDAAHHAELTRLYNKASKAKSKIVGYNVDATRKDAYKTIENISNTIEQHRSAVR